MSREAALGIVQERVDSPRHLQQLLSMKDDQAGVKGRSIHKEYTRKVISIRTWTKYHAGVEIETHSVMLENDLIQGIETEIGEREIGQGMTQHTHVCASPNIPATLHTSTCNTTITISPHYYLLFNFLSYTT